MYPVSFLNITIKSDLKDNVRWFRNMSTRQKENYVNSPWMTVEQLADYLSVKL